MMNRVDMGMSCFFCGTEVLFFFVLTFSTVPDVCGICLGRNLAWLVVAFFTDD